MKPSNQYLEYIGASGIVEKAEDWEVLETEHHMLMQRAAHEWDDICLVCHADYWDERNGVES